MKIFLKSSRLVSSIEKKKAFLTDLILLKARSSCHNLCHKSLTSEF